MPAVADDGDLAFQRFWLGAPLPTFLLCSVFMHSNPAQTVLPRDKTATDDILNVEARQVRVEDGEVLVLLGRAWRKTFRLPNSSTRYVSWKRRDYRIFMDNDLADNIRRQLSLYDDSDDSDAPSTQIVSPLWAAPSSCAQDRLNDVENQGNRRAGASRGISSSARTVSAPTDSSRSPYSPNIMIMRALSAPVVVSPSAVVLPTQLPIPIVKYEPDLESSSSSPDV